MESQLRTLVQMQALDDKIGRYKELQGELPKQLNEILDMVDLATAKLLETETQRAELAKKLRAVEMEIKTHQEQAQKYGRQLSEIKTNKEYKALNSEIAYLHGKISDLESVELEIMDEDNELKKVSEADKAALAAAEKQKSDKEGDLRAQIDALEAQIEETRNQRNELARSLPTSLIKTYGNMIKNRNNKAVAFVTKGACNICGFNLRPQVRIEIQQRGKVIFCESCGRILIEEVGVAGEAEDQA